jgi:hypothetical protein
MTGAIHPKHHVRFYLVLITVVMGAIFYLLVSNNDFSATSLTGSSVGVFTNDSEGPFANLKGEPDQVKIPSRREIDTMLTFDQVPEVNKDAKIASLELHFINDETRIKVNNDLLELNEIEEVTLRIKDFVGFVNFNEIDFSLDGVAKRIEVNGVAFSSKVDLSINLESVEYSFVMLDGIELNDIEIPRGSGHLELAEKLSYTLEQEQIIFNTFNGLISIDKEDSPSVNMEGVARGVSVSGALLDVQVE